MSQIDLGALDPVEIGRLMRLLASTDVEECDIQSGDYSISIKRAVEPLAAPSDARDDLEATEAAETPKVLAPAVGVFHRSEGPADAARIGPGSAVKTGDVLGVIEVMGVPHPVLATLDGTIDAYLVEDGEAVEYGEPILTYRPATDDR